MARRSNAAYETLLREAELAAPAAPTSLLSGRKAFSALEENKTYSVILQSYTEKGAETPTEDNLGYITFKWLLPEDGRIITDTRNVPMGTDILCRQLLEQFSDSDKAKFNGQDQAVLLQAILNQAIPCNMWVQKVVTEDSRFFTNHLFQQPIAPAKPVTPNAPTQRMNLSAPA